MAISHYAFRALRFQEQVIWVWDEGRYLATRYEEEDTIGLYYMAGRFFVELYYDHVANVLQTELRTFTSVACLEDYTCYIDLNDLSLN